ncbi:MAG: hypothetical protein JG774_1771 [Desulfomicrobiaceae bacterium]|jgi:hypothetical protein|nr:DUF2325 domain-containing protein [Desulfomicrobiaceae bacterium]MBZ4647884.1 hypothetical protein [Desulfomicrobiaceae bacterium]MBZ4686026.1 hypothetical protein [Desulfomicrobiaceae bacterium]MDI3492462.1 hypothetical protein [Desulfomicrobiaceae bacterium]MDK2873479.1 hypothetical protein [Desulfomicrobiaceae bacterium]
MKKNNKINKKKCKSVGASRIMVLGGVEGMAGTLRQCLEERGFSCFYHPGHMTSGCRRLEEAVRRSRCVLCCLRCNSHGACLAAKKFCRKHGVPIRFVPNVSISSIKKILTEVDLC